MAGAENPLVVFVSSVMDKALEDLAPEREAAIRAIRSLKITRPWAFEGAPASADPVDNTYLEKVDESDIFVLILGAEITKPVEDEYKRAASVGKRRLIFVKNVGEARSERAQTWLSERRDIKYARFYGPEDLEEQVVAAVGDELIKSHRRLQLQQTDFERLAASLTSQAVTFMVRTIEPKELKEVTQSFSELESLYPDFSEWVDRKVLEISKGTATAYVAQYGSETAGFALVSDKLAGVRKLSTLYMKPTYQGLGVGPRLLLGVIEQCARDGIEKLYLTVSEERREQLEGLLSQFGFFVEGVSGRRYRAGSWEWIWSKRFVHGLLRRRHLERFVLSYLLHERGLVTERIRPNFYRARLRYQALGVSQSAAGDLAVGIATENAEDNLRRFKRLSTDMGCKLVFVCLDGSDSLIDEDVVRIDALDLETVFFPLYVEHGADGLIIPIREVYAQGLIPRSEQRQLLEPTRVQLRTDNVYYRYPNVYHGLNRASPLFFYETHRTAGTSRMTGEAKLLQYKVGTPEDLLAELGRLGVYRLNDLRGAAMRRGKQSGKALALRFDWYREMARPLTTSDIASVLPTFNARTARRISFESAIELRRLAGWNVTPLSFR